MKNFQKDFQKIKNKIRIIKEKILKYKELKDFNLNKKMKNE